ncbi:MAG: MBL fold metallo-hydrolase [Arcobacteraceae bacterium]|nr:MBL fold metallo-hydrolase [Arcobacteraceae bacterium]
MFKKIVLFLSVVSISFGYDLKPIQISKSVYQFIGKTEAPSKANGGNMVNTYWIKTDKSYIVVDTGPSYNYAKDAHKAMKKIADLPIKYVINTHMHDDHWLGNNYFKELGATIYGTKAQAKKFPVGSEAHMLSVIKKEDSANTKIINIDTFVEKDFSMKVDNTPLDFIHFDYAVHTPEDIMIYLPEEKTLIAGDILFSQRITSIRDGSVEGGLKSLDAVEKMDVKVYAAGHGKFTDKTALQQMRDYFMALKTTARKAIEDGIDINTYVKTADFSAFKDMAMMEVLHKGNLGFAYSEYEFFEEK